MVKSPAAPNLCRPAHFRFIIIIIVILAFLPSLSGDFVNWDDRTHIIENDAVASFDVSAIFRQTVQKIYIPLTTLSFAIEHRIFGFNAFIFHLNNLLFHVMNCLLVYAFAQRLGLSVVAAFWATLIFGVHPMKVESVAWVTERKDLLYAFFYLAAMLFYLRFLDTKSWRMYALSFSCGTLSLLAKPMALSLPLVFFLLDWFCRRDLSARTVVEKAFLAVVFIPITWITYAQHIRNPIRDPLEAVLMWTWSFMFYIRKFLWPDPLVPVYPVENPASLENPFYATSLIFFLIFVASAFFLLKNRWWIMAVGFYALSVFFVLRFDPQTDIHVVADRFMYLPCLGFCLLFGLAVDGKAERLGTGKSRRAAYAKIFAGLVVVGLALKSVEQCGIWNNSLTLWTHVIKHNPTSFLAHNNRAVAYIEKGHYDLGLADYAAILKFDPGNPDAHYNRGLLFKKIGRYLSAIDDFTQVILRYPHYEKAYVHRGRAYEALGQDVLALSDYNRAVTVSPAYADGYLDRGNLHNRRGHLSHALADYQRVIEFQPGNVRAVNNLGTVYAKLSEYDRALVEFNRAIAIDPGHADTYYNRSVVLKARGQYSQALKDALEARSLGGEVREGYLNELKNAAR